MENCPETQALVRWLNGATPEITEHVESCQACQQKLETLTDVAGLSPPHNADSYQESTLTNEPHFQALRKALPGKVSDFLLAEKSDGASKIELDTVIATNESTMQRLQPERNQKANDGRTEIDIEGFRIEKLIGRGGFAHVYQGWEERLSRPVAIKVLDRDRINARNRHRFLREAKTASSIESPNVVRVLTSGETENGRPYIVMELVRGQSLAEWIENDAKPTQMTQATIEQGVRFLIQACLGAQAVHEAGLIHRDIKPGNVFVDSNKQTSKLGDFGLARIVNQDTVTLTRTAELVGTPAYMSPEQTRPANENDEQVSALSDVYSLGAALYNVLTGQPPFRGSSLAIIKQVNDSAPIPPGQLNESISRDMETICLKALEKEPRQRYGSASELAADLQRALDRRPIVARPISSFEKLARWGKSNKGLATSLALLFLTLLTASIVSTTLLLRANAAEEQAKTDRTAILESFNDMVDELYDDLANDPGSAKAREAVVDAAIKGLNSITKIDGDQVADRTSMLAYRRLGNLMEIKGATDQATQSFNTSIGLARDLFDRNPSVESAFDLAKCLEDLAGHYSWLQTENVEAQKLNDECYELLGFVLEKQPNHKGALSFLLTAHSIRLEELHFQNADQKIIELSSEMLADVNRLLAMDKTGSLANVRARDIRFKVGRAKRHRKTPSCASKVRSLIEWTRWSHFINLIFNDLWS